MVITGSVWRVTVTCAVPALPTVSVAVAVMVFGPSTKEICAVNVPLLTRARILFTVTVAVGSSTVPVTVIASLFTTLPVLGAVIVTTGGMISAGPSDTTRAMALPGGTVVPTPGL